MAKQFNFTGQAVDRIKPPKTGRDEYRDTRCGNLYLRVTPAGHKSYAWFGRVHGKLKRITIGSCDDLRPAQAREAAEAITGSRAMGQDPHADRKQKREELTLGDACELWMEYAKTHKRSWQQDEKRIARYFPHWSHRRLSDITPEDARRLHARIADDRGPVSANTAVRLLSSIFRRAIKHHDHAGRNPCETVDQFREESRERFMDADELRRFFDAVDGLENSTQRDFFRLLVFTGARKSNVMSMMWDELDLRNGRWTIPASKSKNKRTMCIVLSADALEILKRRQKLADGSPWVLPGQSASGHIGRSREAWDDVVVAAGIKNIRVHDLRRTRGSVMAQQGCTLNLIAKVLGHHGTRSTEVYARFQTENLRDAVNAAGAVMRAAAKV